MTSILLLIFGTVGNSLIILVMSQRQLRKTAFGCYLIAIAVNDTVCVWVGLSRHLLKNLILVSIYLVPKNYGSASVLLLSRPNSKRDSLSGET